MTVEALVRARDRLIATVAADMTPNDVMLELLAALHDVAVFDGAALMLTDPETMLPSGAVIEGWPPESCVPFWDNELLDPDFLKFNDLARRHDPVGTLHEATDGDLMRSPRYQKLLAPSGASDELRAAFTSGTTCWAVVGIVRPAGLGPFPPEEISAVRDLVPVAARSLRHVVGGGGDGTRSITGPAMLVVGADGDIETMTPDAETAVADLAHERLHAEHLPTSVLAAARRAKSSRSGASVAVRARGMSGTWMKVHAAPLGDDGRVAVMIEPARPTDLVPILLESYGLTARETEVVFLLSRGLSTKDVAAEMCISAHTVNDHIKVIYAKVGVSSRGELVAKLFSDHLIEAYHDEVVHL